MKLNLGCGNDAKSGYLNADFRALPGVNVVVDLTKFPWPWADESVDEILMLDFFEHISYRTNGAVLDESWRVLNPGGDIVIQVPDFAHSAAVIEKRFPFICNKCEQEMKTFAYVMGRGAPCCPKCGHRWIDMRQVAMQRLYGGQDYEGNWHNFSFTQETLQSLMSDHGFRDFQTLEKEHQWRQWSLKIKAKKGDPW